MSAGKNARLTALKALLRVEEGKGYSNLVLDHGLAASGLDGRDAAFASALFYGVLERRITLDYQISRYSKMPLSQMAAPVREILRLGFYQLLYMDKIPQSAAVNESVKLTRAVKKDKASGFVNGILRSFIRDGCPCRLPAETADDYLMVKYACPQWIIDLWITSYGRERALELVENLTGRPPLAVRVNSCKTTREALTERLKEEGVETKEVSGVEQALTLERSGSIESLSSFQDGFFHVQDLASQLCCQALSPKPGERVYDVCAAPGGKTFTMAELMENQGELSSFDLYPAKVKLIQQGAKRLGLSVVNARIRDAAHPEEMLPPGDKVLCDVPCSGLGIIRRKPEIRYKNKNMLDSLPDLQYLILCISANLTKKHGVLLYSTCTLNPGENNQVARRFLLEHPDFEPYPVSLPEGYERNSFDRENEATLFVKKNGTDGFFFSGFRRLR